MSLTAAIKSIYQGIGPNHIIPFIGEAYENDTPTTFRVAVVGLNAYVSDGDWPADPDTLRGWYPSWWKAAGHLKTHRFFNTAYKEANILARELATRSSLFGGLKHDDSPQTKAGFFATNAVKELLREDHKKADGLTPEFLAKYTPSWHRELDAMSEYRVMPHLIVVFGAQIWTTIWQSLHPTQGSSTRNFSVVDYQTCGTSSDPCFHRANRIMLKLGAGTQTTLLVRLAHPAAQNNRRADWLLKQSSFTDLAAIS